MASPVSFGDAVAMSKIAWNIAHAFSKGRKSAPAEFREVENQLHSLSSTLAAFKDICIKDADLVFTHTQGGGAATVTKMLENCNETLTSLQKIVEKYGGVSATKEPRQSRLKRWNTELVKNYKKIVWITEAGDLATLRSQLMVHTTSLGLVLGIMLNSRTSRLEDSLQIRLSKLDEIHGWWAHNLKNNKPTGKDRYDDDDSDDDVKPPSIKFRVSIVTDSGPKLLCPDSSIQENWESSLSPLFICNCGRTQVHTRLETITLSPTSFIFRQTGTFGSWTLYRALDKMTNRLVTFIISLVKVTDLQEFENSVVKNLAETGARGMLQQGITNHLAHLSPDMRGIRLLNLQSDIKQISKFLVNITFKVQHRSLCKANIDAVNLLHYREIREENSRSISSNLGHAELLVYYNSSAPASHGDITSSSLHLTHQTKHTLEDMSVVIEEVECLGFVQDIETSRLEKAGVTFQMESLQAAATFHQKLKEMIEELFMMALASPRPDEVVVLHLPTTQVECDVVFIQEGEVVITRDQTGKSRLIVTSSNVCTVLVQNLSDDFFASNSAMPNFASPTWLIQVDMSEIEGDYQRKVIFYPNGFMYMSFHSANSEGMFQMARGVLSQGEDTTASPIRRALGGHLKGAENGEASGSNR
ncbi:hypothetical protein QBC44DRAFT_321243 [Cladorrhinum sp. PSN332]|nr:hypothetical protein QBC44DRAFT_321243 [Cladorrhinum sp. PSN332]